MRVKNGSEVFNGTVLKVPGVADMYDYEREMINVPEIRGRFGQHSFTAI